MPNMHVNGPWWAVVAAWMIFVGGVLFWATLPMLLLAWSLHPLILRFRGEVTRDDSD